MKPEELKKIARCYAHDELKDNHGDVEDIVASAFIDGVNYADAHPRWISVEDELPTKAEFYLCVIGNTIQVLFYNEGLEEWYEFYVTKEEHLGYEDWTKKVTHWMPLPQPPHHFADVSQKIKKGGEE